MPASRGRPLTPGEIDRVTHGQRRREIKDTTPGLYVFVAPVPSRRKTFVLRWRLPSGRSHRVTLGEFALRHEDAEQVAQDRPSNVRRLTLREARALAASMMARRED